MSELTLIYGRQSLSISTGSTSGAGTVVPVIQGGKLVFTASDQTWFWTEEWQRGEIAVQADINDGRVHRFLNVEDAIAALGLEDDAGD